MNDLNLMQSTAVTMDSREIAELTGKRHDNVTRDIESQLGEGVPSFEETYRNEQNGQVYKCYKLPFRETMILISGYSVDLRSKIIDRWIELEGKKTPKTFADALQLAADQARQIEQQSTAIAIMEPKAAFFDAVADSKDAINMGDAAKVLAVPGLGQNKLFEFLRGCHILMSNNQPFQKYIDAGYFRVIEQKYEVHGEVRISFKTLVYQRGLEYIRRAIEKLWLPKQIAITE